MISKKKIICPENLIKIAKSKGVVPAVIVNAGKLVAIKSAKQDVEAKLIKPIFIGDKPVIEKISNTESLVIIDSLNGFFNLLEGKKDIGRLINSFLMVLVSSAKHTKSTVLIGALSKLNDENKFILYNTGRHVIENKHFTKIQLTGSGETSF